MEVLHYCVCVVRSEIYMHVPWMTWSNLHSNSISSESSLGSEFESPGPLVVSWATGCCRDWDPIFPVIDTHTIHATSGRPGERERERERKNIIPIEWNYSTWPRFSPAYSTSAHFKCTLNIMYVLMLTDWIMLALANVTRPRFSPAFSHVLKTMHRDRSHAFFF